MKKKTSRKLLHILRSSKIGKNTTVFIPDTKVLGYYLPKNGSILTTKMCAILIINEISPY